MILRLSTSTERFVLLAVSLLVGAFLIFISVRGAWAVHSASLGTEAGLRLSTRLEPDNPDNWFELGRFWQFNLENSDIDKAITAYRVAASMDPHSADTYINLATAYETQNDIPAARQNFLNAKRAYPLSAEVSWRVGNFFLRQGELEEAFRHIRASVQADPSRGAEAFSRSNRVEPDLNTILDKAIPNVPIVLLDIIHDLSNEGRTADALLVWDRLVPLHPDIPPREMPLLVNALRAKKETAVATRVWNQEVQLAGLESPGDPPDSILWDGGFESGLNNIGYSWSYSSNSRGVEIQRDTLEKRSGAFSLRLTFDGKSDVTFADVCHNIPVNPQTPYVLWAWVQTRDVTSDQGIRLRIQSVSDRGNLALTPEVHGSNSWTRLEVPWTSEAAAFEAQVCIVRLPSDQSDSHIRGAAWVDNVAVVPAAAGANRTGTLHP